MAEGGKRNVTSPRLENVSLTAAASGTFRRTESRCALRVKPGRASETYLFVMNARIEAEGPAAGSFRSPRCPCAATHSAAAIAIASRSMGDCSITWLLVLHRPAEVDIGSTVRRSSATRAPSLDAHRSNRLVRNV